MALVKPYRTIVLVAAALAVTVVLLTVASRPERELGLAQMLPDSSSISRIIAQSDALSGLFPQAADRQAAAAAAEISAAELLARPLTADAFRVPRLFHQSWKTHDVHERFRAFVESCRRAHPGWRWVVWSNEDNRALVAKYFPSLLDTYDGLPQDIERADLARNLYMYIYGGVYADMDVECLRPSEVVFEEFGVDTVPLQHEPAAPPPPPGPSNSSAATRRAFFGRMGPDKSFIDGIPNAWMASTPGHPFFLLPLQLVDSRFKEDPAKAGQTRAESLTGPDALRQSILRYQDEYLFQAQGDKLDGEVGASPLTKDLFGPASSSSSSKSSGAAHEVAVLPPQVIFPYSHTHDAENKAVCWEPLETWDAAKCKQALLVGLQGSVTITYWTHTW